MNTKTPSPEAPIAPNTLCTFPADPFAAETPEALRDAWERTQQARRAVTKEQLCPLNFDLHAAVLVMRGAVAKVYPLRAQLVQNLPLFDVRSLDLLLTYAAAMLHGDCIVYETSELAPPAEINAEAEKMWDRLVKRLTTLAEDGLFPMAVLDEVRPGTGWRDRSIDLRRMATVAQQHWERIGGQTTLTTNDLSRAIWLANHMDGYLSTKGVPVTVADLELERRQAIALAYNAYDDVRRAMSWLRWKERDALQFVPSVFRNAFTKRTKSGRNEGALEDGDEPAGPDEKPATPNTNATAKAVETKKPAEAKKPAPVNDDDDGPIELGPNGLPLVPQDDPFAKD